MNKHKRDLLKVMSVAGAAGAVWKKPVVDGVLLPVHAQFSIEVVSGGGGGQSQVAFLPLLDTFVPAAHANNNPFPGCASFHWAASGNGTIL